MPTIRSSPPHRLRSPGPPVWDTPPMPCKSPRRPTPSLPPSPSPRIITSPAMQFSPPPTPSSTTLALVPVVSRSGSISSTSSGSYSSSSGSSQRVSTPPPPTATRRSRTNSKLLPALPLYVQIETPFALPRHGRIDVEQTDGTDDEEEEGEVIRFGVDRPKSLRSQRPISSSTPPRPPRRDPDLLLAPKVPFSYSRSASPSSISSISTASEAATPKAAPPGERSFPSDTRSHELSLDFALALEATPMGRKRDSAQRRLSALRGLVANLDFNQPWSISERPEESEEIFTEGLFWACGGESIPPVEVEHPVSQDHGWPAAKSEEIINSTPIRQTSLPRVPQTTPPRRRGMTRSNSDLHFRTPEPPRPPRHRHEISGVATSGYSKSLEPNSPLPTTPTSTWRSSLVSDDTYNKILQIQGPIEVKRQEIMWEMCETEQAFVKSMRTVLRLFAIPLKTPQGKWIHGISSKITDLFDYLEGVAHAHGIIAAAQRDMRRKAEVLDIAAFIGMFKTWVHRLEVHESYLLRFEAVVKLVEDNVRDPESVFGEFVRMQTKDEVLGNMSLGSMLLKPVQRLTKYPLFLKRLLDVTVHPHPAQPEILSLLSKTESIILTLQASKAREEDFESLQALEAKLHGLPVGFNLAVRGRKLMGQGLVSRILPGKETAPTMPRGRAGSLHSSRGSISSTVSSSAPSTVSSSPWDFSALTPSTCRTSAFSVSSASSSSYFPPSRSNSITQTSPCRPGVARSPSSGSSIFNGTVTAATPESRPSTPSSISGKSRKKEEALTMFIFDDLVIVATSGHEKSSTGGLFHPKKKHDKPLRVLSENEGGIGKVLEAKDGSGWQGHSSMFTLTLLPLNPSLNPSTTAYTLPHTHASPKKNHPSTSYNCQSLTTLTHFITSLAQATSTSLPVVIPADETRRASGVVERVEVLSGMSLDGEWIMDSRTVRARDERVTGENGEGDANTTLLGLAQ